MHRNHNQIFVVYVVHGIIILSVKCLYTFSNIKWFSVSSVILDLDLTHGIQFTLEGSCTPVVMQPLPQLERAWGVVC